MSETRHDSHVEGRDSDHEAPGGSSVNRVASVATSAALGGAAAGALAGAVIGPAGAAAGAVIGAVAAGFAGNAVFDSIDEEVEESYWKENFSQRPYATADATFLDYGPAYRHGIDGYVRHRGRSFDEAEAELAEAWPASRHGSSLDWQRARLASRDSWDRLSNATERALPGDADGDGR